MRLDALHLTRFGHFTDRSLTFPPPEARGPDLHIIYGPNEAGKSTLFAAWMDFLYAIPKRTRHDFLHPMKTLQIGADLQVEGQSLSLRRLKRDLQSLVDRHDHPLPESVLQAALSGLTRENYEAMFSLDEATLVKGGDHILSSRGDLGEMLFSASAGLAELSPKLEAMRTALDGFHRKGKRSGILVEAKRALASLQQKRKDLEVSASAIQALGRAAEQAQTDLDAALTLEGELSRKGRQLQQALALLPLRRRLAEKQTALAEVAGLPVPPPQAESNLRALDQALAAHMRLIASHEAGLEDLTARLAALQVDPALLAQGPAIAEANALLSEHDSAVNDLPRRLNTAAELRAALRQTLSHLGREGPAEDLVLPTSRLIEARQILSRRSGIRAALSLAKAELEAARTRLAEAQSRHPDLGHQSDDPLLPALLAEVQRRDPQGTLSRAEAQLDAAKLERDRRFAALHPWQGRALTDLPIPTQAQMQAWHQGLETARREVLDLTRQAAALAEEIALQTSQLAPEAALQAPSLQDAARLRQKREALWAAHLATLTPASAEAFEVALRQDDHLSALLAQHMAEARTEAAKRAELEQRGTRLAKLEAQAQTARLREKDLLAQIAAATRALGLPDLGLADLGAWLQLRLLALQAEDALTAAGRDLQRAQNARAELHQALVAALGLSQSPQPFALVLAEATTRHAAAQDRQAARRMLAQLQTEVETRAKALLRAEAEAEAWRGDWRQVAEGTHLAASKPDSEGLEGVVETLDRLGGQLRDCLAMEERILKMQNNRDRFQAARAAVLTHLGLAPDTPWAEVLRRLRHAEEAARDHEGLLRQAHDLRLSQDRETRAQALALTARTDLAASLGLAPDSKIDLAEHLARSFHAQALRLEVRELEAELARHKDLPALEAEERLEAELSRLREDLLAAQAQLEQAREARHSATQALAAVGGDDALALVLAERQNLLLDLGEATRRHLAGRLGLATFEEGLRRFREEHRSTMLTRASQAFARLSGGAYPQLATQMQGAQEVLVATARNGSSRMVGEMSKGTRFQLYLALRIAGYHEIAKTRAPVPFIADDIMESFDDARSAQTFALLGEMAQVGQVIYLTHHRHLCEIAAREVPSARILDLTQG